jgi:uncharacterized protein (UPF0548 family)
MAAPPSSLPERYAKVKHGAVTASHQRTSDGDNLTQRPRFFWSPPSVQVIAAFREQNAGAPLSYREVGESAGGAPAGYTIDQNRELLGHGEPAWERARAALCAWTMFPAPWTRIEPVNAAIEVGNGVAMIARACGLWWLNACRIVYVVDERGGPVRRFGFAYGTLRAHVEQGEERFLVEMLADGSVWYDLRAFSRPRYWPVRLGKPWARRLQKRFARESKRAMRAAVEGS